MTDQTPRGPQRESPPARSTHAPVGLRVGRTRAEPDEVVVPTRPLVGSAGGGRTPATVLAVLVRSDRLVAGFLIVLAAALRLPGLMDRGIFDADQGRDMLVIYDLVEKGQWPLLGPETISILNSHLHHGAFYWYLFAPAAWLAGGNPTGVLLETVVIGIAGVVATWWAGRLMGGPAVGAVAGLLLAVSPAAVEQSIFLWNPNPIPVFAALAIGGAWKAHQTGGARWYALAMGSAVAVYQLHLLGAAFVVGIGFLIAYDLVRAVRRAPERRAGIAKGIAVGVAVTVVLFLPLIVNELQTGFSETQKMVQFLLHGGAVPTTGGLDPFEAFLFIVIRILGWPFVGLVLDVPLAAVVVVAVWLALVIWWLLASKGEDRLVMTWLLGIVAFSTVALDVMAPWLRFVVIGFPTDHYHAFLNPVEVIAVSFAGVAFANGAGAIRRGAPRSRTGDTAARVLMTLALVGELVIAGVRQPGPSAVATWPKAEAIGRQIVQIAGGARIAVVGLPDFKSPDSIGFPIVFVGGNVVADVAAADWLVINCDDRFKATALNEPCGGGAEDDDAAFLVMGTAREARLATRFDESDALKISVYQLVPTQP
jgi:hypothetical protein